jgi:hypothetical protein
MYNKKVIKVEPALDKHGHRETYLNKNSGKVMYKTVVFFEGGSSGVYSHEGETQDYFKPGEMAEFKAEKTQYGIKLYKTDKKKAFNRPTGWVPKSPGEVKRDNVSFSGEKAVKLMIEKKAPIEDFPKYLSIIQAAVNAEVDKIKDE